MKCVPSSPPAHSVAKTRETAADLRLASALGDAMLFWTELIDAISTEFRPLERHWKPTKLEFGWVCLLKQAERTLAYLIPGKHRFEVSIVLGNRAAALALDGDIRHATKKLITEARVYAEGRGIRFEVDSADDVLAALQLVRYKTTPR